MSKEATPEEKKLAHDTMLGIVQRHGMRIALLPLEEHEAQFELMRRSLEESVGLLNLPKSQEANFIEFMMTTMRGVVGEISTNKGTA